MKPDVWHRLLFVVGVVLAATISLTFITLTLFYTGAPQPVIVGFMWLDAIGIFSAACFFLLPNRDFWATAPAGMMQSMAYLILSFICGLIIGTCALLLWPFVIFYAKTGHFPGQQ